MAPTRKRYDLVVIGGGPAGSTLATLVKKYNPSASVLLLEKERFPRHHIGESLLPSIIPVLKEMGAFEKIDGAGFIKKLGASYVWGDSPRPWTIDFNSLKAEQLIALHGGLPEDLIYAWQVRRARYDQLLLEHARAAGVEVAAGQACELVEEGGRVVGLVAREGGGRQARLSCRMLADCSGQAGFLSRFKPVRRFDPRLKNVAAYSYFRGAAWKYRFTGHPDKTRIFVCAVPCGWFWFIPLETDLVSVGLVTTQEHVEKRKIRDMRSFFDRELSRCAALSGLLKGARRVTDVDGTGKDFFLVKDWSYLAKEAAGPGWLCAGDAAFFVDPIFSSGVTLAHLSAHRAAYTITTSWAKEDPARERALWRDYTAYCQDISSGFLMMAVHWYGWDRSQRKLWKRARQIYESRLLRPSSDRNAYTALVSGVLTGLERLVPHREAARARDYTPSGTAFPSPATQAAKAALGPPRAFRPLDRHVPRLSCRFRVETSYLPVPGTGKLRPVPRVLFLRDPSDDPLARGLNPRMHATLEQVRGLLLMDGRRSLGEVKKLLRERHDATPDSAARAVELTAKNLRLWGLASFR